MTDFLEKIVLNNPYDKYDTFDEAIEKIISIVTQIMKYWKNVRGWAPDEAAELLGKSMLDLQISLSESLRHWTGELTPGDLTLAWANLGALVEGQLKLFLSVYYLDYLKDEKSIKKIRKENNQIVVEVVSPDKAKFEDIRIFFRDNIWRPEEKWDSWILMIQQKRNNIHAFKYRNDLGVTEDYVKSIFILLQFIQSINDRLPYHDDQFKPYPFIEVK